MADLWASLWEDDTPRTHYGNLLGLTLPGKNRLELEQEYCRRLAQLAWAALVDCLGPIAEGQKMHYPSMDRWTVLDHPKKVSEESYLLASAELRGLTPKDLARYSNPYFGEEIRYEPYGHSKPVEITICTDKEESEFWINLFWKGEEEEVLGSFGYLPEDLSNM